MLIMMLTHSFHLCEHKNNQLEKVQIGVEHYIGKWFINCAVAGLINGNLCACFYSSTAADNIFSMLADEVKKDGGDSEVRGQRSVKRHINCIV